jgi:hypothetical protein
MKSLDAELVCSKRRACLLARRRQGAAVAEMCAAIHDDDVCACLCLALGAYQMRLLVDQQRILMRTISSFQGAGACGAAVRVRAGTAGRPRTHGVETGAAAQAALRFKRAAAAGDGAAPAGGTTGPADATAAVTPRSGGAPEAQRRPAAAAAAVPPAAGPADAAVTLRTVARAPAGSAVAGGGGGARDGRGPGSGVPQGAAATARGAR